MTQQAEQIPTDRVQAFAFMHEKRLLGTHETISGSGSKLMETRALRRGLQLLIERELITSIIDIGCGDCHWLSAMDLSGIRYTGIDIVPQLIEENRRKYPALDFKVMDIAAAVPDKHDMVLCRDVFTHLSLPDITESFNRIKQSGARYFATTGFELEHVNPNHRSFFEGRMNIDITPGYWRPVNMRLAPFHFSIPLWSIQENQRGKTLDIWALDELPVLSLAPREHNPVTAKDFGQYVFFRKLCALPFVEKIVLYGSRAGGTHRPDSDIDLALYCNPQPTREQWLAVCNLIDRAQAELPLGIDCYLFGDAALTVLDTWEESPKATLYERGQHG